VQHALSYLTNGRRDLLGMPASNSEHLCQSALWTWTPHL